MLEAEIKIPLRGTGRALLARLRRLGASEGGEVEQEDIYFAHPTRDFRSTDEAIRLRREPARFLLTYKGPKLDSRTKTREELEVEVQDGEVMRCLLGRLGFRPLAMVRKRRRRLSWAGLRVAIDRVVGLGTFVEIEASRSRSVRSARKRLFAAARVLGLPLHAQVRRSYLELLAEKRGLRRQRRRG